MSKNKKSPSFFKKVLTALFLLTIIGVAVTGYFAYRTVYKPNVEIGDKKSIFIHIPTGASFQDVSDILFDQNIIVSKNSFELLAEKKGYKTKVKPGRYRIKSGMNNNELINLLKAGLQEPVEFTLNGVRTKEQLASRVGGKLEVDSAKLNQLLNDNDILQKYGFNKENVLALFIPKTYQFNWNTNEEEFLKEAAENYKEFWTEERKAKAKRLGLTQTEVSVIASIVQQETYIENEKTLIAGVYINRLNRNMPLQADPTLIWAANDFKIQRVLNEHKLIDSPYNTYKNRGLPPGPICLPTKSSLDAVLNYKKHDYLYFCAKEDFSGCSNFSKTYEEHRINARRYQKELNRRNIKR